MSKDALYDTSFPLRKGDIVCVYKTGRIAFERPGSGPIYSSDDKSIFQLTLPREGLKLDKNSAWSIVKLICMVTNTSCAFIEDSSEDKFFFKIQSIRIN
jgi:hypothetical protein